MLDFWPLYLVASSILGLGFGLAVGCAPALVRRLFDRRRHARSADEDVPLARLVRARVSGARRAWVQRAEAAARAGWLGGDPLVVMTPDGELEEVP